MCAPRCERQGRHGQGPQERGEALTEHVRLKQQRGWTSSSARPLTALPVPGPRWSVAGDQGVPDGLRLDEAIPEDEGVDAVLHTRRGAGGRPLQEEDLIGETRRQLPVGVGQIGQQGTDAFLDAFPASQDAPGVMKTASPA